MKAPILASASLGLGGSLRERVARPDSKLRASLA